MTVIKVISVMLVVALLSTGCSVYKAASQPEPANLQGLGVGTSRTEIVGRLGAPKTSDKNVDGTKEDIFEFYSGMGAASKARIILYLAADFFTLTLAELVLWPIEMTVMEKAECNAVVTYNSSNKVETMKVTQKSGIQGC